MHRDVSFQTRSARRGDQRAEAEAGAGPSRGSQSTCGTVCPQQGQCWAAPCALQASAACAAEGSIHLLCQHSLQHPVFGKHRRCGPPAEVPEAGAGGWGQGSGERWPGRVAHPGHAVHLLMLGVGARPGLSGLGVMTGSSGTEGQQAAVHQQQVPQRPAAPTFCHLGWEGSFFFLFVFCPFLLLCVCLFHRAGSRQGASLSLVLSFH